MPRPTLAPKLGQPALAEAFRGTRFDQDHVQVEVDWTDGTSSPLFHVVNYSPTGMEWGYDGAGPHDLALSLCTAVAGQVDAFPTACVLLVRDRLIATIQEDRWEITATRVLDTIADALGREGAGR